MVNRPPYRLTLLLAAASGATLLAAPPEWPGFRGPNGSGVSASAHPPAKIGPTNGPTWQIDVPWSPSSPIVAGNRIFLTAYADGEMQTLAYDRATGNLLWKHGVKASQLEIFHQTENSPAGSTPVTDGRTVVSYFGSFGFVAYGVDGRELWRHPLPVAVSGGSYGSGVSPTLAGSLVILNRDQDVKSSILALNLATGKTAWETARPDNTGSFGTAILWNNAGVEEVVAPGSLSLKAYDVKTGAERWVISGLAGFACTTPVVGDGMLYYGAWSPGGADAPFPSWDAFAGQNDKNKDGVVDFEELDPSGRDFMRGFDEDHDGKITEHDFSLIKSRLGLSHNFMIAVRPGGKGDIAESHVAWKFSRGLPYVPSPLFYEGRVYFVKDGGMLTALDAKTGAAAYTQERLDAIGSYYASPVAADGRLYVASLTGRVTVVKTGGDKPAIVSQADFGDRILATPALAGDDLYLRTAHKLYAFGANSSR